VASILTSVSTEDCVKLTKIAIKFFYRRILKATYDKLWVISCI